MGGARHAGQQCHSGAPWGKEQTRAKHNVRETPVWNEQWDRATRGTRRAAAPSRKWERARRNDNLDQSEHVLWFGAGVAPRCASEVRPYRPKLQRRALSRWHRGRAVAAGPQRGDGWLRRTAILKQAGRQLPYLSKHVGGPPGAQPLGPLEIAPAPPGTGPAARAARRAAEVGPRAAPR